ncbi:MAG: hypothetical protein QXY52_02330 [Conexivisphaerales archaeon]
MTDLNKLRESIQNTKKEISSFSPERYEAVKKGNEAEHLKVRVKSVKKVLEGCKLEAQFIEYFSKPLGAKLNTDTERIERELDKVVMLNNLQAFHEWMCKSVVPTVKLTEQLTHISASVLSNKEGKTNTYKWTQKGED